MNVTTDPDLKREVLDGSIARFVCRTCRYTCKIEYDLLYHDMTKHIAVWLKYPVEGGFFNIDPAADSMSDVFGETYIRRVVPSYEELVEKIVQTIAKGEVVGSGLTLIAGIFTENYSFRMPRRENNPDLSQAIPTMWTNASPEPMPRSRRGYNRARPARSGSALSR